MMEVQRRKQAANVDRPGVDQAIGEHLRHLRKMRRMSLVELAHATGLSIGFISQIERGLSSPNLRALTALADALSLSVAEVILGSGGHTPNDSPVVTRAKDRKGVALWRAGMHKQVLAGGSSTDGAPYSFSLLTLHAGAGTQEPMYTHEGEEAGYVLRGQLRLHLGSASWVLKPGDSFQFASQAPHRFESASRSETSVVMFNLHSPAGY